MIWLATVELMLSIIQIASFFHLTPPKLGGDVLSCFWVFHYQSLHKARSCIKVQVFLSKKYIGDFTS